MSWYINALVILLFLYAFAVIVASSVNSRLKSKGLEGIYWKECFNPFKIFSVFFGIFVKNVIPLHVFEQYVLRFYDSYCRPHCLNGNKGHCVSCGCDTEAKMWSPFEKCSQDNWFKIVWNKKKYERIRKESPIEIKITYKNEQKII